MKKISALKKVLVLMFSLILLTVLTACEEKATQSITSIFNSSQSSENTKDEKKEEDKDSMENSVISEEEQENTAASENEELVDGMRPAFKEAMDSYEIFYDEYCEVVKKYNENSSDLKLLASYTTMMAKAVEMSEKFEAWEEDELNDVELKYYLDVNNRIAKKLIDVSAEN